jgi:hypothetical protein
VRVCLCVPVCECTYVHTQNSSRGTGRAPSATATTSPSAPTASGARRRSPTTRTALASRSSATKGAPSPGADVAAVRPVSAQMWQGRVHVFFSWIHPMCCVLWQPQRQPAAETLAITIVVDIGSSTWAAATKLIFNLELTCGPKSCGPRTSYCTCRATLPSRSLAAQAHWQGPAQVQPGSAGGSCRSSWFLVPVLSSG